MIRLANRRCEGYPVQYAAEFVLVVSQGETVTSADPLKVFKANLPDDVLLALTDNGTRTFQNWQKAPRALKEFVGTRENVLDEAMQSRIMIQQIRALNITYSDEKRDGIRATPPV